MAAKEKTSSRWSAWLAPILFLLAAVAAAGPASALTCGALETRAWEKTSSPLESRPVELLQLLNLHQQNEAAGYDDALGSPLAAESGVTTGIETRITGNQWLKVLNERYGPGNVTWSWPGNRGYIYGSTQTTAIYANKILQRTGDELGTFVSPAGTAIEQLSLRPGTDLTVRYYLTTQEIQDARIGLIAPAFDQLGFGEGIDLPASIKNLVNQGKLFPLQ